MTPHPSILLICVFLVGLGAGALMEHLLSRPKKVSHRYQNAAELVEGVESLLEQMPHAPEDLRARLVAARSELLRFQQRIRSLSGRRNA